MTEQRNRFRPSKLDREPFSYEFNPIVDIERKPKAYLATLSWEMLEYLVEEAGGFDAVISRLENTGRIGWPSTLRSLRDHLERINELETRNE